MKMKTFLVAMALLVLSGCGARVHTGVMETVTYHDQTWTVCSGSVWDTYNTAASDSELIIDLPGGQYVRLHGDYKIESNSTPCHF